MQGFLLEHYGALKALHISAVVAWMAGLMYLPRLYIYHHQSQPGGEAEKHFVVMERRLLKGITNPSAIVVWTLAGLMLWANPGLIKTGWFHLKLAAVIGVTGIHALYARAYKRFAAGERPRTEKFWRIVNEAPFVLMLVAIFMAVTEPF